MAQENSGRDVKSPDVNQRIRGSSQDAFTWWKERTFIRKEDTFWVITYKVLLQILGVIALVIASPMLLLALLTAFLVAL